MASLISHFGPLWSQGSPQGLHGAEMQAGGQRLVPVELFNAPGELRGRYFHPPLGSCHLCLPLTDCSWRKDCDSSWLLLGANPTLAQVWT